MTRYFQRVSQRSHWGIHSVYLLFCETNLSDSRQPVFFYRNQLFNQTVDRLPTLPSVKQFFIMGEFPNIWHGESMYQRKGDNGNGPLEGTIHCGTPSLSKDVPILDREWARHGVYQETVSLGGGSNAPPKQEPLLTKKKKPRLSFPLSVGIFFFLSPEFCTFSSERN